MTSPHFTFDLMRGYAHFPSHSAPPAPVLAAFGIERLSECRLRGSWDFERAITENPQNLHRCEARCQGWQRPKDQSNSRENPMRPALLPKYLTKQNCPTVQLFSLARRVNSFYKRHLCGCDHECL